MTIRKDDEPPEVTARDWRYRHLGIPTDELKAGERYLEQFGLYVSGFEMNQL